MRSIKSIAPEHGLPDTVPERALGHAVRKNNLRMLVICQALGLAALALIVYLIMSGNYRILKYVVCLAPALLVIPKPSLTPYLFILNFFVQFDLFGSNRMLRVMFIDAVFLFLIMAFVSNNRNNYKEAIGRQRPLFIILCVFMLWAVIGIVVNCYDHTNIVNVTSAFFVFNIAQLAAAVVIFSHSAWKEHRDRIILFYVICSFVEIVIAILLRYKEGAKTFSEFYKLTGTLGVHPGMLANLLLLSFGVALCAFFELRNKYEKRFSLCVAVMCIFTVILFGTRSVLLGLFLGIPMVALLNVNYKWTILAVILLLAVGAVGAPFIKWTVIHILAGSPDSINAGFSSYGRVLIWERVYEHALYGPWLQKIFGIGIGSFNTLKFSYYLEVGTFTTGAHNNLLHAFVETGIIGMLIFIAIWVEIIRNLVIRIKKYKDNAARSFLLCTLILLFSGLTQETFWFNPSYGRFWMQYIIFYLIIFNFRDEDRFVLAEKHNPAIISVGQK